MSIKSDNWIKKMSLENDMISPFQPNQVKTNEENNEKLISQLIQKNLIVLALLMLFKMSA